MKVLRIIFRLIGVFISATIVLIAVYLTVAVALALIPVNSSFIEPNKGIRIYITSNGAHADLTLPVVTTIYDWQDLFLPELFGYSSRSFKYISFGWGDLGFYTQTPTWSDLQFSIALKALFYPSPSAMHVTYHVGEPDSLHPLNATVVISPKQYQKLVKYVIKSFDIDNEGNLAIIKNFKYGSYDRFYHAKGYYTLFNTSNNWTNRGLKEIGVKTATWAPFDKSVLYHLK